MPCSALLPQLNLNDGRAIFCYREGAACERLEQALSIVTSRSKLPYAISFVPESSSISRGYRSRMPSSYLSDPLDDLLQRASMSPARVDKELDRLARDWQPTILKPGHEYLRQIRERTGINVVGIQRRYRRLLVEIMQFKDEQWVWRYHERSRSDCVFACAGEIPHTIGDALPGRPLRALTVPTSAIGAVIIDNLSRNPDGGLSLAVTPEWRTF